MIITVELSKIMPNGDFVYEENLQEARERWNQKSFNDGSWIEVVNLDSHWSLNYRGEYFLPDGNHRSYIAYFEKGLKEAKVTLKPPRDFYYIGPWNLEEFRKCRRELNGLGIRSIPDLFGRIKPGNWRTISLQQSPTKNSLVKTIFTSQPVFD